VRLFFAVFPDSETRGRIAAAAQALALADGSRWVPAENYHLTLAFIGEVPRDKLGALKGVGAAQRARKFTVRLDAYEYWPKAGVVIAAASACPEPLEHLHRALGAALERCDVALDSRPFRPHITMARKVPQAPVLQAMSEIVWTPRSFQLVRSVSTPDRSVYTVVDSWPLLDKVANPP
jgi:RNA 2',3'-cyclic 3'-phosphodiesterase